jgi:hypothetical protein
MNECMNINEFQYIVKRVLISAEVEMFDAFP